MKVGCSVACSILFVVCIVTQTVSAAPIAMPDGSKVWMKFEAGACPDADGDDCLGSNQAGPNPPNGIPMSTFGSGDSSATGFAEIVPGSIRSFASGLSVFMHSSFEDTYTVRGTAAGPFDIPVELHATGVARPVFLAGPSLFQMGGANGEVKIGTFQILPSGQFSEGLRVSEFSPQARTNFSFPTETSANPFSHPIDVTATHTVQGVNVGDSFVLAFGMNSEAFPRRDRPA